MKFYFPIGLVKRFDSDSKTRFSKDFDKSSIGIFLGLLCETNIDCKYFTWGNKAYDGVHGTSLRKKCHLKNDKANETEPHVGLISGAKDCRQQIDGLGTQIT